MRKFLFLFILLFVSLLLASANRHYQTTADPVNMYISIDIGGEDLSINLEAPGLVIDKYSDGSLKHLTVPFVNSVWEIYFHPPEEDMRMERVSLIQRFSMMNNRFLLNGLTQSFDKYGNLISEYDWKEGALHGESKVFNSQGQVLEEMKYDRGFPIEIWKQYYENGEISVKMIFPLSREDWEKTQIPKVPFPKENVYSMPYHHPRTTIEVWYNEDGIRVREIEYKVYQDGDKYVISKTGKAKSFDLDGKLTQEMDDSKEKGKGCRKLYRKSLGVDYVERQVWFSGKFFNATRSLFHP